jgi:hypothetical protein
MVVYFVQGNVTKTWKIGYTGQSNPTKRIETIQAKNKFEQVFFKGFIDGDIKKEKALHERFSHLKLPRGEDYFRDSREIRNFVVKFTLSKEEYQAKRKREKLNKLEKKLEEISKRLKKDIFSDPKYVFKKKSVISHLEKAKKLGVNKISEKGQKLLFRIKNQLNRQDKSV